MTSLINGSQTIRPGYAERVWLKGRRDKHLATRLTISISATCLPDELEGSLCAIDAPICGPLQHEVSLASCRRRILSPIARAYTRTSTEVMASASAILSRWDRVAVVQAANHLSLGRGTRHPSSPRNTPASFDHPTPSSPGYLLPVIVRCQGDIASNNNGGSLAFIEPVGK